MREFLAGLALGRSTRLLDVLLATWVAAWVALGVAIGIQVDGLRQLSGTIARVGQSAEDTGRLLSGLGGLPLAGARVASTGHQIEQAGRSAVQSARRSRASATQLSWMLSLAVAFIPSMPVLCIYLPCRMLAARERRNLIRLWSARAQHPAVVRLLAQRALTTMPYGALMRAVGDDPWDAYAAGSYERLARAELARWRVRDSVPPGSGSPDHAS